MTFAGPICAENLTRVQAGLVSSGSSRAYNTVGRLSASVRGVSSRQRGVGKSMQKPTLENTQMLILTRRVDERIFIGDDITLCVLDIEGNRVRLGLEAPRDVAILREEVQQRYDVEASNDAHHSTEADSKRSA